MSVYDRHRKTKNRLLKVCYVPATSAGLPMLLFLMRLLTVLMKQTRQAVCAIKQSLYFDVYGVYDTTDPQPKYRPSFILDHGQTLAYRTSLGPSFQL